MDEILIKLDETIYNAFYKLQKTKLKCLIVVNNEKKLLGTLTDGDLRRALLKKIKTSSTMTTGRAPLTKRRFLSGQRELCGTES